LKVGAIVVAAGNSTRMNGENKLLIKIDGIEVVARTLINFNKTQMIDYIVIVTREDMIDTLKNIVKSYNITKANCIVAGGQTRQESVEHGLKACPTDTDIIAIHDGARPFAGEELITNTINACIKYGAAMPGVPVKDTIKLTTNNFIANTPARSSLYIAQTPQIFNYQDYKKAFEFAKQQNKDFTDDCQLVENIGKKVFVSEGDYKNIKITTQEDIIFAKAMGGV